VFATASSYPDRALPIGVCPVVKVMRLRCNDTRSYFCALVNQSDDDDECCLAPHSFSLRVLASVVL
jgi:hypothetical protein